MVRLNKMEINPLQILFELLEEHIKKMRKGKKVRQDLWGLLASEQNYDLITKLKHVEQATPGFGTIVVPKEGFSLNPKTDKKVRSWLTQKGVHLIDPTLSIAELENSLKKK